MSVLFRLRPFRLLAFVLIDTNLFRHSLEERLKREYVVRGQHDDAASPSPLA